MAAKKYKVDPEVTKRAVYELIYSQDHKTLPQRLNYVLEVELWKKLKNQEGKPFESFQELLLTWFPYGFGLEQTNGSLTREQLMAVCKGHKRLESEIAKCVRNQGRPEKVYNVNLKNGSKTAAKKGNSREYLLRRLEKDHPKIHERFIAGEFRSARAAAIEAGIIKTGANGGHDPLMRLKNYWKKASPKQRAEFKRWLRTRDAK